MSHCAFEVSAGVTSATSMAKNVFMEKKKLFTGKMNLEPKKRKMKCLVWSLAQYAAETWMLAETDRRRLEAFEMWIWRGMEKVSWLDEVTNEEVLNLDWQILNCGKGNIDGLPCFEARQTFA